MFNEWIQNGEPEAFWMPGFFFTQSFLTGVKQGFSRKIGCSIDKVEFEFQVLKTFDSKIK